MPPLAPGALGTHNRVQGNYGEAVVDVIAAAAGLAAYRPDLDLGFDRCIEAPSGEMIRAQVKSVSAEPAVISGELRYALDLEAYDRLRKPMSIRSFLILVEVPAAQHHWIAQMNWGCVVRRRAHFVSLTGKPPSGNTDSVTVGLPVGQLLTPPSLFQLVEGAP